MYEFLRIFYILLLLEIMIMGEVDLLSLRRSFILSCIRIIRKLSCQNFVPTASTRFLHFPVYQIIAPPPPPKEYILDTTENSNLFDKSCRIFVPIASTRFIHFTAYQNNCLPKEKILETMAYSNLFAKPCQKFVLIASTSVLLHLKKYKPKIPISMRKISTKFAFLHTKIIWKNHTFKRSSPFI